MALQLYPFPRYQRLSFGLTVRRLPYTREGLCRLPPAAFPAASTNCYAQLRVRRYLNGQECRAITGLLPSTAFIDGTVLPHEKTLLARIQRQEELVRADEGALAKPVLLTVPSLKEWWARQDEEWAAGAESLVLLGQDNAYTLRDYRPRTAGEAPLPLNLPGPVVIADGHHRAATHAALGERGVPGFAHVPVCVIGADELHIGVFARVITAPWTGTDLLATLAPYCTVTPLAEAHTPQQEGDWLLLHGGNCYALRCTANPAAKSDTEWLDTVLLPACFGITDVRADSRIAFEPVVTPPAGVLHQVFPPEAVVLIGFALPRVRFFSEVTAGGVFPPKSTRFEPRIPSGLVVWQPEM